MRAASAASSSTNEPPVDAPPRWKPRDAVDTKDSDDDESAKTEPDCSEMSAAIIRAETPGYNTRPGCVRIGIGKEVGISGQNGDVSGERNIGLGSNIESIGDDGGSSIECDRASRFDQHQ